MPPADLRAQVADELEALCAAGAPLHMDAAGGTWRVHAVGEAAAYSSRYAPARVRLHGRLIERFLETETEIITGGCAAVATAGPPAVGKSTRLGKLGYDGTWRRIDPDAFKTRLIEHDLRRGTLALPHEIEERILADGGDVMPLELAGLYHRESTVVADKAQEICMAARENVIIEGTLSWDGLPRQLVDDLVANDYTSLDVVLVEAPLETALEQALQRWWLERRRGGLGGRFTPAAAIRNLYRTDTDTVCADVARDLVDKAQAAELDVTLTR